MTADTYISNSADPTSASTGDSTAQGICGNGGNRGVLHPGGTWDRPSDTPNLWKISMGRRAVSQDSLDWNLLVVPVHLHSIIDKAVKPQIAARNLNNAATLLCYR